MLELFGRLYQLLRTYFRVSWEGEIKEHVVGKRDDSEPRHVLKKTQRWKEGWGV